MEFKIGDKIYCFKSFFPESDTRGTFYVQRIDYKSNVVRVGHHPEPFGGYANGIWFYFEPVKLTSDEIYKGPISEKFEDFFMPIKEIRKQKLIKLGCGPNTSTNTP